MGLAARAVALMLLLLAFPAQARDLRDPGTPLPPILVQAESTGGGVLVSWSPPVDDGGSPVESYTVYRLGGLGWNELGTVASVTTDFLDGEPASLSFYRVVASNGVGPSEPSGPALGPPCAPVGISVDLSFPFVHYGSNPDCWGTLKVLRAVGALEVLRVEG